MYNSIVNTIELPASDRNISPELILGTTIYNELVSANLDVYVRKISANTLAFTKSNNNSATISHNTLPTFLKGERRLNKVISVKNENNDIIELIVKINNVDTKISLKNGEQYNLNPRNQDTLLSVTIPSNIEHFRTITSLRKMSSNTILYIVLVTLILFFVYKYKK